MRPLAFQLLAVGEDQPTSAVWFSLESTNMNTDKDGVLMKTPGILAHHGHEYSQKFL